MNAKTGGLRAAISNVFHRGSARVEDAPPPDEEDKNAPAKAEGEEDKANPARAEGEEEEKANPAKAEGDENEEEDAPVAGDNAQAARDRERLRTARVLADPRAEGRMRQAARLLSQTDMSSADILGLLGDSPRASRGYPDPQLRASAPAAPTGDAGLIDAADRRAAAARKGV